MMTGGWCAPAAIELRPSDLAEYRRQWPVGGPCSTCEGAKTLLVGPSCPCPLCEADEETRPCWGCDGTGIEQEHEALGDLSNLLTVLGLPELPEVSVRRGGIRFSGI